MEPRTCAACGREITERERYAVMPAGDWIHTPCPGRGEEPPPRPAVPDPVATGQLGT